MKYANETFFFIYALLLLGIFFSSIPYIRKSKYTLPSLFWLFALGSNIVSFFLFSIASFTNLFLLTIANTLFVGAYLLLLIFVRSLNKRPSKRLAYIVPIFLIIFAVTFEMVRQFGSYQGRVSLVLFSLCVCLVLIIIELVSIRKKERAIQLTFLLITIVIELVFLIVRLSAILLDTNISANTLYQEPLNITLLRLFGISFTVLSYISILGYWGEKLTIENFDTLQNSDRVTSLLAERDTMIATLLKANKSSTTEALSASIAHELNQPIGATLLNAQLLKMLQESKQLNSEAAGKAIDQLEIDARRSGDIIRSLRSIFARGADIAEMITFDEIAKSALAIYKSELISKNIQIKLDIDSKLKIFVHHGQFLQALLNLLNNAMQILESADPPQKIIFMRAYKRDGSCIVEIEDTGPGVPENRREDLFKLLSTTKPNGMGIGLWLCHHVMDNFGSKIAYEVGAFGGAKFVLTLPLALGQIQGELAL